MKYSGILIFQTSKGYKNWFEKLDSLRNQGYNYSVWLRRRKQLLVQLIRSLKKLRVQQIGFYCSSQTDVKNAKYSERHKTWKTGVILTDHFLYLYSSHTDRMCDPVWCMVELTLAASSRSWIVVAIFWWPHLVVWLTCWTGDVWGWTLASEKSNSPSSKC